MPWQFGTAIFFAVVALIATIVWFSFNRTNRRRLAESDRRRRDENDPHSDMGGPSSYRLRYVRNLKFGVIAVWALTALMLFWSSATQVTTKNDGIVTSFGRPVGSLSNGFHMVAPWDSVTELDAAIQTESFTGSKSCVTVRIARQATGCVDVTTSWRIRQSASDELFQDFRDFTNIRDNLVDKRLAAVLNDVFEDYDPLGINTDGTSSNPPLSELGNRALTQLRQQIGTQVEVLTLYTPVLHFDDATQSRINSLQAQIAQTRIAQQSEQTAIAQAQANGRLAASVSNDPNVLVSRCFDLLNEMVKDKQQIPVGFSCWPSGGSSVVVPAAGK